MAVVLDLMGKSSNVYGSALTHKQLENAQV